MNGKCPVCERACSDEQRMVPFLLAPFSWFVFGCVRAGAKPSPGLMPDAKAFFGRIWEGMSLRMAVCPRCHRIGILGAVAVIVIIGGCIFAALRGSTV